MHQKQSKRVEIKGWKKYNRNWCPFINIDKLDFDHAWQILLQINSFHNDNGLQGKCSIWKLIQIQKFKEKVDNKKKNHKNLLM